MSKLLNKMRKRKGFTIVDLVIVIAVIAILAAVLIPTFANVIQKAQESAALQRVTSAYKEALALALADDGVVENGDQETVDGFTFEFRNNGADATVSAPQGFAFSSVTISDGKVVLGDPNQVVQPANIKVLSQNVRFENDGNGNDVEDRFPRFKKLIEEYQPDLIGLQEPKSNWITLLRNLEGYAIIGQSRAGEDTDDEWNAIMYKTDRFTQIDSGTFWLTPTDTSDVPGTIVKQDGDYITWNYRICTWAVLEDKYTGETIVFANTHLDDTNDTYREQQAEHLLANLEHYVGDYYDECTIYLTGDFNCEPDTAPYNKILSGGFTDSGTAATEDDVDVTFHGYGKVEPEMIDFCFYKGNVTALEYEIITENYDDNEYVYVSDHYGVIATFQNNKSN